MEAAPDGNAPMTPPPAGYSGTPLARKLGIAEGNSVTAVGAPREYKALLAPIPKGVTFGKVTTAKTDVTHVFVTRRADLERYLLRLRKTIRADATVWVSWPKKAAGITTNITEQTIRDACLPIGFVDVKVCAVNDTWSGLKLVIRKELR